MAHRVHCPKHCDTEINMLAACSGDQILCEEILTI